MAKHIEKIASELKADIVGKVPENSGGAFGAARLAHVHDALSRSEAAKPDFLGSMRDDADLLDEIVADAMRQRKVQAWHPNAEDFTVLEAISEATGQPLNTLLDDALRLFLRQRTTESSTG